jgi:hypothetical protein
MTDATRARAQLVQLVFGQMAGQVVATAARLELADLLGDGERTGTELAEADLYLLESVLHDWSDDRESTILAHCRAQLPEHGRLLVVEPVLPPLVDGTPPPMSDLNMLVNLGGRERTRTDFEQLLARAGLTLTSVTPLPAPAVFSLLEAAAA